jgi:hypothetical protein
MVAITERVRRGLTHNLGRQANPSGARMPARWQSSLESTPSILPTSSADEG